MNKAAYKTLLLKAIGIFSVSFLIMTMAMNELEQTDLDVLAESNDTAQKIVKKVRNGKVVDCAPSQVTILLNNHQTCHDTEDGSLTAQATGGYGPYTYSWSSGQTTATITGLTAGTYSVTVTNYEGTTSSSETIVAPPALSGTISTLSAVDCNGGDNASLLITASGGTATTSGYTYLWSTTAVTATISGLTAGTYTVTIMDENGCTATQMETVEEPAALAVSIEDAAICYGETHGSLTATTTGGTAAYSYAWSNGGNASTITGLTMGSYTVTVTDGSGCTTTDYYYLFTAAELQATIDLDNTVNCNGGADGQLTANASGGGIVAPPTATPKPQPKCSSCPDENNYTFLWSTGAETPTISGLTAGTYTVTVTDDYGCTITKSETITEPPSFTVSIDDEYVCYGLSDGMLTATTSGGTAAYSYSWNNGGNSATISGLSAGTYTVTVTDGNSCTTTSSGMITEHDELSVIISNQSNVSCFGGDDGSLTAMENTVLPPMAFAKQLFPPTHSYSWSNGGNTATITGLSAGTYTVTISNASGCTATTQATIMEPTALSASIGSQSNVLCNGASTGSAMATVSGGTAAYGYLWSNGGMTATVSGLSAGTYTVTVTDGNSCTTTAVAMITEPTVLGVTASTDSNVSCNGDSDGGVTASASGGTMPYTYEWNTGGTSASISGLSAGTYTVTVTDMLGCTSTDNATITEPSLLALTIMDDQICNSAGDGELVANPSGGTSEYTYLWSTGATSSSISGLSGGTYTLTVTDMNSCTITDTAYVYEATEVTATIIEDVDISCNGEVDGQLTVQGAGGQVAALEGPAALPPGYTYLWSNGATTPTISGLTVGTYSVTVTDEFGCTGTTSGTITEPDSLKATVALTQNASSGSGDDGILTASATGGTTMYTYNWSNGATTAENTGLSSGTYTVTITDQNGCEDIATGSLIRLASLGDHVWLDLNEDGVFDENEPGIPGVTVRLYQCDDGEPGDQVGMTLQTDENGQYLFEGILPGEYCIEVDPSTADEPYAGLEFEFTTFQGVLGETVEMDANGRAFSSSIILSEGENNLSFNVGITFDGCFAPFSLAAVDCTEDGATLTWESINLDEHDGLANHCWKIVVTGAGAQHATFGELGLFLDYLGAGIHASLLEISICADDPALSISPADNIDAYAISYELSSELLQPGTAYWFAVAEICDDMPPLGNTSLWNFQRTFPMTMEDEGPFPTADPDTDYLWDDYEGYFKTKDDQFEVETAGVKPTCPDESEAEEALKTDGCITVTVADGESCWASYWISIDDEQLSLSDSEEGGSGNEFAAGTYTFCGLAADTYTVKVELTDDSCNPPKTFLTQEVEVPNGMDMESPKIIVSDYFAGSLLADNVEGSTAGSAVDLGEMTIPEGSCSMKSYFQVVGIDNCDGQICEGSALTATVSEGPENVDPGTQITIYNLDGEQVDSDGAIFDFQACEWIVEVNWAVGASTVEICLDDAEEGGFSAPACITLSAELQDVVDPNIVAQATSQVIPACNDEVSFLYGFTILDACDNEIDPAAVNITATSEIEGISIAIDEGFTYQEGSYFEVFATISDPAGVLNTEETVIGYFTVDYVDMQSVAYSVNASLSVVKAIAETAPKIIVSGDSFTALACEDGAEVVIGVTVTDDCEAIADELQISGISGLSRTTTLLNGLSGYFEYTGVLEANDYSLTAAYPGADPVTISVVVEQADKEAPVVDLMGNSNFVIPACSSTIDVAWSIQITDDCDEEIDLSRLCIYLGAGGCTSFDLLESVGVGYQPIASSNGMALIELRFPIHSHGGDFPFRVTYEDEDGLLGESEVTIHFEVTPDEVPPVIISPHETIIRELDPCASDTTDIVFSVSAIDNCDGSRPVQVTAPGNVGMSSSSVGDAVQWTITYPAREEPYAINLFTFDGRENVTEQVIWVEVTQGPKPPQNLSCNTNLTALLDENCSYLISPDLALEGTFGCLRPEDILIDVDNSGGPTAYGSGEHEFKIYLEGNYFCTGTIVLTDNIPPSITCPTTTADFICTDIEALRGSLDITGEPLIADNCDGATYSWYEETIYGSDETCDPVKLKRVFTVTDGAGLTDECTQYITIRKPTLDEVVGPDEVIELSCDAALELDDEGHPAPSTTGGYPYVPGYFDDYKLAQTFCNLAATYRDSDEIEVCGDSYKFTRTWTVLDWCEVGRALTFTQLIKVGDFIAPEVAAPTVDYDWDGVDDILTYSTGPFNCTASFEVPLPVVSDNCSDWSVTTEILAEGLTPIFTIEAGANRVMSGVPVGCHAFRYWVTDGCGNQTDITVPFIVEDQVAPTAICNEDLNITVDNQGYARVRAEDIDEGSWDNCGPVRIEVRRMVNTDQECSPISSDFTEWGDYVDFSCCDIGTPVRIELRVWDDANGDGIWGNEVTVQTCDGQTKQLKDNSNICWLEVTVEDKQAPYCIAPHAQSVSCADLPYDFDPNEIELLEDLFGQADFADNCLGVEVVENAPVVTMDDCGTGTILRSFTATDAGGLTSGTCQQLITITEVHNYEIRFPADSEADCGIADPDTISFNEIGCDLLAISAEDEFFSASSDECYKIFRTYRVINWCEYDGEAPPVVVSRDEDCDGKPGDEAVWVLRRPNDAVYFDRDNNESNTNPAAGEKGASCDGISNPTGYWIDSYIDEQADRDPITGQDDTGGNNDNIRNIDSRGYWQYTQVIKIYDSVDPVITVEAYEDFESLDGVNCDAPVTINFTIEDECTKEEGLEYVWLDASIVDADGDGNFTQAEFVADADMTSSVSGEAPNYTFSAELPEGLHALLIKGSDGCGNAVIDLITFTVVDAKAPSPICINGLAVELMPTEPGTDADGDGDEDAAAMAIWANDFVTSPIYDCNGQGPEADNNGNLLVTSYSINLIDEEADRDQTGLILTCDSEETTIVQIHAWDEAGNHDFCETFVLVQDLMNRCGNGAGAIAGVVETAESMESIADVQVRISGAMNESMLTLDDGAYHFTNIPMASDVSIYPWKDIDPLNGVSTFDLILISQHILGEGQLDSPWKLLAADANNNGSITTVDVITIRRLILGMEDNFPENTSWRFFEETQEFSDPTDPWSAFLREVASINDVEENMQVNFKGIKIGDVNESAQPNSLFSIDERTQGAFALTVEDMQLQAGQTYRVDFKGKGMTEIAGYQGTLSFAQAIELVDINYGVLKQGHFGTRHLSDGLLPTSWNGDASDQDVLFTLVLRAKSNVQLSEALSLSSRVTPSEAYNKSGDRMDLEINFSTGKVKTAGFELYQNQPNPFQGETLIPYFLPEAAPVTLMISDVTGKTLKVIRTAGLQGRNQIVLRSEDLQAAKGILYYTIATDKYTATRKMIVK
ncbi:MAG: T9SS type A sorting domain-containing protein [Saprospiraceae bacterium]|nr:T9SS type A sorting domain-containing protein [Saprospiraceae bacterium]